MAIGLIAGAGLAIAASVGPAREWRSAMYLPPADDSVVDRSGVVRSEGGVPGSISPQGHFAKRGLESVAMGRLGSSVLHNGRVVRVNKAMWAADPEKKEQSEGFQFTSPTAVSTPSSISTSATQTSPTARSSMPPQQPVNSSRSTASCPVCVKPGDKEQSAEWVTVRTLRADNWMHFQECITRVLVTRDTQIDPASVRTDISAELIRDENDEAAQAMLVELHGVDRFREYVSRNQIDIGDEYLREYVLSAEDDGCAHAVLGVRQLLAKRGDLGLRSLSRACDLASSAFAEPIELKAVGVSDLKLGGIITDLMAQKLQKRSAADARALAAACFLAGRTDAAKKLLDQAVSLGSDPTEIAVLAEMWKITHKSARP